MEDHFHEVLASTPGYNKPGNQVDVDSFISARNQEVQAILKQIGEQFLQVLKLYYL